MLFELINLGNFEAETDEFMVSDPCYDLHTWCQGKLTNVKNGIWTGYVNKINDEDFGDRCATLFAIHSSYENEFLDDMLSLDWMECEFLVGVDSGQAGIFDISHYSDDEVIDVEPQFKCDSSKWYEACCDQTLGETGAGIIPFGVVSSSGYGDGGYSAYVVKNHDKKIVAVKIEFITDEDFDEETDDDFDEDFEEDEDK